MTKKSLFDLNKPISRKGIAGWKLTKRPSQAMSHAMNISDTESQPRSLVSRQKYTARDF